MCDLRMVMFHVIGGWDFFIYIYIPGTSNEHIFLSLLTFLWNERFLGKRALMWETSVFWETHAF